MSGFTKALTRTYNFDGDAVRVCFRRMNRVEAMKIGPFIELQNNGTMKASFKDNLSFIDSAAEIIEGCVISVSGLTIDGKEINAQSDEWKNDVLGGTYFMSLMQSIFGDILANSFANGDEVGKSQPQPQESSTA